MSTEFKLHLPDSMDVLDGVTDFSPQLLLVEHNLKDRNSRSVTTLLQSILCLRRTAQTLTSSKGKRSWKMRLILAPPDSSLVSTWSPEPSMHFSKSTPNCCTILKASGTQDERQMRRMSLYYCSSIRYFHQVLGIFISRPFIRYYH